MKCLSQGTSAQPTQRAHVDPNATFPLEDNFSVGTIHGGNTKPPIQDSAVAMAAADVVEIQDDEDDGSVMTSKTIGEGGNDVNTESRVASGSSPINGPTTDTAQPMTAGGSSNKPARASCTGGATGGPTGK